MTRVPQGQELATFTPARLPYHPQIETTFGIAKAEWKTLTDVLYRNATTPDSIVLVLSYCRARKLDPMKKPVHIVPIWDKEAKCLVDTVWPGIGELRTTAFRTGQYAGRDEAEFGDTMVMPTGGENEIEYPEWCRVRLYRMVQGQRIAFTGPKVYWRETYATNRRDSDLPNEMWGSRPFGQLEKCAEAAALRATFPEEIGSSDYIPEEIEHQSRPLDGAVDKARLAQAAIDALKPQNGTTTAPTPQTTPAAPGWHQTRPASNPPAEPPEAQDDAQGQASDQDQQQDAQEPGPSGEEAQDGQTDAEQPQAPQPSASRGSPRPSAKPKGTGHGEAVPPQSFFEQQEQQMKPKQTATPAPTRPWHR